MTIGQNQRLEVTVSKYDPRNVHCGSRAIGGPPEGSCTHLVENLYQSNFVFTFGKKGDPGVVMPLPYQARYRKYEAGNFCRRLFPALRESRPAAI